MVLSVLFGGSLVLLAATMSTTVTVSSFSFTAGGITTAGKGGCRHNKQLIVRTEAAKTSIPLPIAANQVEEDNVSLTFTIVPPSTNPRNKLTQHVLHHVLPKELNVSNIHRVENGGRIVFTSTIKSIAGDNDCTSSPPFSQWASILSPHAIKSLRLIVGSSLVEPDDTEQDILLRLREGLSEDLPWMIYREFGNITSTTQWNDWKLKQYLQENLSSSERSLLSVSCRRYTTSCIPEEHFSSTSMKHQLIQTILLPLWGNHPLAQSIDSEFTLLLLDNQVWLEWTILIPPPNVIAATMCLPRPGCKRVEAWMLVQTALWDWNANSSCINAATMSDGMVILDPLCGKGTYLVEAASTLATTVPAFANSKNVTICGVDLSKSQLEDAAVNVEASGCHEVALHQGDARDLTNLWSKDGSVTTMLTCPPFGRQFGRNDDLAALYLECIREWTRLLDPKRGRMTLLVDVDHQKDALNAIRQMGDQLQVMVHREPFRLGRLQATVIVARRCRATEMILPIRPASRLPWEGKRTKEARAEWERLRAASLQQMVLFKAKKRR